MVYSILGILMLTGLFSMILATYSRYTIRFWQDDCRAHFLSFTHVTPSNYDVPPTRFLYFIHASNIPLIIALLPTHIPYHATELSDVTAFQPHFLSPDFVTKNAYWKRKLAYANT